MSGCGRCSPACSPSRCREWLKLCKEVYLFTMKIAITGGAGFIGSQLTRAYLDARHDVFVIDTLAHGSRQALDPRARFYHLDIRDRELQTILQLERPDIVSHHVAQRATWGDQSLIDAD